MLAAVAASSLSFQAPAAGMLMQPRAAVPAMALEDMVGKYSIAKTVFDPLDLASKYDLNWLREAEIKHGRLCMLAFAGWITVDAGITFPGPKFEGIKSLEAHDIAVANGSMWALLLFVSICEYKHMSIVVPKLDGDWGDWEPGNYKFDPFKLDSPRRREIELKNGRAAMLAFSGVVTQCALGHPAPYV
mmetsp:Transcript_7992/g.19742  ORF Transcript_7992/g.19742 Transcript_7992/m.19742 type:complete len:188 (-) Transcript_7992:269-832(-)